MLLISRPNSRPLFLRPVSADGVLRSEGLSKPHFHVRICYYRVLACIILFLSEYASTCMDLVLSERKSLSFSFWLFGIFWKKTSTIFVMEYNFCYFIMVVGIAQLRTRSTWMLRCPRSIPSRGKKIFIFSIEYFWAMLSQVWVRTWRSRVISSRFNREVVTASELC